MQKWIEAPPEMSTADLAHRDIEEHHVTGEPIDDGEKLRRWAILQHKAEPPSVLIIDTDAEPGTLLIVGWRLGHGVEGRGIDECGHRWKRREATIYLTASGRVLCLRVWVTAYGGEVFRQLLEYSSDFVLLSPLGFGGRESADRCVRNAARKAAKVCPLFGVFGLAWAAFERQDFEP